MKNKKILQIYYAHQAGGQLADRWVWCGVLKGEVDVFDYHTKEHLKKDAEANGWAWEVLRWHRNGTVSIIESSYEKNKLKMNQR